MKLYDYLLPHLQHVSHTPLFHGQARVYQSQDLTLYRVFDDGDICHEQCLISGNGRYSDDSWNSAYVNPEIHQIVSLHQHPKTCATEAPRVSLCLFSFPSKEEAQKQFNTEYCNVLFAGYVTEAHEIEVIYNDIARPFDSLEDWPHFVKQLLNEHPFIDIGTSSSIPDSIHFSVELFHSLRAA
uniref:hypothetical protein n=1 Tax=Vibrio cholerae TaxID=666 RepID=UPI00063BD10A|nr:hypothetical protein [Vibrio cholerae]CQB46041.1 hypothetical protein [Vibrio cholerae]